MRTVVRRGRRCTRRRSRAALTDAGQASVLLIAAMALALTLAVALGMLARTARAVGDTQSAVDLAALAAAREMAGAYADVAGVISDRPGASVAPGAPTSQRDYRARAVATARSTASANGVGAVRVTFPGATTMAPLRVVVLAQPAGEPGAGGGAVRAEADLVVPAAGVLPGGAGMAGEYRGPLEHRDGRPMRPDVARAYDRMAAAARADGVTLVVVSGFRSDAEQAVLFARHPDPKWVAPPGRSLHRLGTELDLGPTSAYPWLARHASRFGFRQRYSWEPWHYGFVRNAGSASLGYGVVGPGADATRRGTDARDATGPRAADGRAGTSLPAWVPPAYREALARAARRWNVGAVLLAAQLQAESGFRPDARSRAGALGIAQFMPATARQYGLRDPLDPVAAIDAQAHLMRDLLRDFGAVPLALAAYNAGPGPVRRCACAGPYAETRDYVARILALMLGTGDVTGAAAAQLTVRLVA